MAWLALEEGVRRFEAFFFDFKSASASQHVWEMVHLKMILTMLKSIIHCLYINDKLDPYQRSGSGPFNSFVRLPLHQLNRLFGHGAVGPLTNRGRTAR